MQEIKDVINEPGRSGVLQPVLQQLEIVEAVGPERNDLAVEQNGFTRKLPGICGETSESVRPVLSFTREERGVPMFDAAQDPVPVELEFMKPFIARRYRIDEGCELRLDEIRHRRTLVRLPLGHKIG